MVPLGTGPVPDFVLKQAQKLWDARRATEKAAQQPSVSMASSQTAPPLTVESALATMPAGASHHGGGYF